MVPRGGELESAPSPLLAAHVGEVGRRPLVVCARGRRRLGWIALTAEVRDGLGEVAHGDRAHPGEGNFGRRLDGADELVQSAAACALGGGEGAGHRTQAAVERELADGGVAGELLGGQLV